MNNNRIWLFGVAAVIGFVIVIGITARCVYAVTVANNDEQVELVTACVSNGGSWVVDGNQGECWKEGVFGTGKPATDQP